MFAAEEICEFGRKLSFSESFLKLYYDAVDHMEAAMKGKIILAPLVRKQYNAKISEADLEKMRQNLKDREQTIVSIFLEAVNNHDGNAIMELAKGVWFFKDKRLPNRVPADRERSTLISVKYMLEHSGQKISIRTLAEFLAIEAKAAGRKFEPAADGYSALRRKCKEINFPLAELKKAGIKKNKPNKNIASLIKIASFGAKVRG